MSCLLAQFLKIVFNFFSTGEIRFGIMFETGGMPSSHSALITGATSGIGYELGFDSSIFALSVALALIVMYDACLLYTSPSPRDLGKSRMPSSA